MKTQRLGLAIRFCIAGSLTLTLSYANAAALFSDNFNSGASPLWGNEVGGWSAAGGAYKATAPANMPNAISSLPFILENFSIDFDINAVEDGGIFLRSTVKPGTAFGIQGVALNLKVPDGGPKIYWHIFNDGNIVSAPLNIVYLPYGSNPHVHVEVSGNTFSAFLNGSSTPATTLTTGLFPTGRVALYDFSAQSFDNVVLVPEPSTSLLLISLLAGAYGARKARLGGTSRGSRVEGRRSKVEGICLKAKFFC